MSEDSRMSKIFFTCQKLSGARWSPRPGLMKRWNQARPH